MAIVKTNVVRITQSPLNEMQWRLNLTCGLEVWHTQKTRPKTGKPVICPTCTKGDDR